MTRVLLTEFQARRNAMEASITWRGEEDQTNLILAERLEERWRHDQQVCIPLGHARSGLTFCRFQILYNRQRQAAITGELVEIITGATASEDM